MTVSPAGGGGGWGSPSGAGLGHGGRPGDDVLEHMAMLALIVAAALVGVVLAAGHLSALLAHGGWPRYGLGDVPGLLWRLVQRPAAPEAAWAPVNRGMAPAGGRAWWATFVVLASLVAAPVYCAHRARERRRREMSSEWARPGELRPLRVRGHQHGRLVVGTNRHRPIAVEKGQSLLVFGPTGSGKTTGLSTPAILEWPGPVVATSVKGDLVNDTIGWRSQLGDVHVFDPSGSTDYRPSGWSPLAGCDTWAGASSAAHDLAMAGKAAVGSGMQLAEFWYSGASKSLAPYLFAAAKHGRPISDVARWIDSEERDEVLGLVQPLHPDAALAHEATFRREDRARSSLFQVMQQILGVYLDPAVARSADRHDIVVPELLDGGAHTLYVTAPSHDQARFRPLFGAVMRQVFTSVFELAAGGTPLPAPLLVVLEEAANIAPVEDLPTIASTARSMGLQLVTIFQDQAQIAERYGQSAGTIVNNHRAKLFLPGISDTDTLELASRLAGDREIERDSVTSDAFGWRRSVSTSQQWRRLLPPERIRELRDGHGVLLYGNLPPVQLRLRRSYKNRRLRGRAAHPQDALPPVPEPDPGPSPDTGPSVRRPPTSSTAPRPRPPSTPRRRTPAPAGGDVTTPSNVTALDAARARLRRSSPTPGGDPQ